MPFLWRRTRENFILFLLMGIIHFIVYQRVTLPDVPSALPILYRIMYKVNNVDTEDFF